MIKSTTKQFKQKVIDYLKHELRNENADGVIKDVNTYCNDNDETNAGDALVNCGYITCYYDEIRATLAEWYEETPEEAKKFDNDKMLKTFCYHLENAFIKLYKLDKVIYKNERKQYCARFNRTEV